MINQVHKDSVIGIKKLSPADLGISSTSHQTHIGLFEGTLSFLVAEHQTIASQLIYQKRVCDLLSLLDYIENPDGSFRSPKIRKGNESELAVSGLAANSVVREIRDIVSTNPNNDWYLLWLGLDTNELVFLLFENNSADHREISKIVGRLGSRKQVDKASPSFKALVKYLNNKIETVNIKYYEELETASQTGEKKVSRRLVPRIRDIEKANKLFEETGRKGEEILFKYFELQKNNSKIKDFKWENQSRETGKPYDFEITNLDNSVNFSDAKSTNYKFEMPMFISSGELKFINENKDKYLIHRIYSIKESPKLRVCDNIHVVSDVFIPNYKTLNQSLNQAGLKLKGAKLAVPTSLEILNFNSEIVLKP